MNLRICIQNLKNEEFERKGPVPGANKKKMWNKTDEGRIRQSGLLVCCNRSRVPSVDDELYSGLLSPSGCDQIVEKQAISTRIFWPYFCTGIGFLYVHTAHFIM